MKSDQQEKQRVLLPSTKKLMNYFLNTIPYLLILGCIIIICSLFSPNYNNYYFLSITNVSDIFPSLQVINTTTTITTTTITSALPPPQPSPPPPPLLPPSSPLVPLLMHGMEDEELLRKALSMKGDEYDGKIIMERKIRPKIAFLFLVRGPLPLARVWDEFFRGYQGLYSIYVHANPLYNQTYFQDSVFYGRRIPSKEVQWGKFNMVEAERRLLANAVLDKANQRFVLLSESCAPLWNFTIVYSYLINSTKSYVEVYDDKGPTGRGRYSSHMKPNVPLSQWRKGSQWFEMNRELALEVISDRKYFPIFAKYCKNSCYGDEHYLPTYFNIKFGEKNSNRTITWVDWSILGPHPGKFERPRVTIELLEKLRSNYTCEYNGEKTNICFLFARKFMPNSLNRLLMFAPKVMKFG